MVHKRPDILSTLAAASAIAALTASSVLAQSELPILTDAELRCQTSINEDTLRYVEKVFVARQECFNGQMNGTIDLAVDCRATGEGGAVTGDPATDAALATARSRMLADVPAKCAGVDLAVLDFPGFCQDVPLGRPFDAFDLTECLLLASDAVVERLIDIEQPDVDAIFPFPERNCRNEVSRRASIMFTRELGARQNCLLRRLKRKIPEQVDCRQEEDALAPATGDAGTDTDIVSAHNRNLRGISNACRPVFLNDIGFPNMCPSPAGNVYPLSALRDCMFATHHFDLVRFLDVMNPQTSTCGNSELEFGEQCDDGDNLTVPGELCRFDCSLNANCGDPTGTGEVTSVDALFVLRAAVGLESCDLSLCDVNSDGFITVLDAQLVLMASTGLGVVLDCPAPLSFTCGNGVLDMFEECDDGDALWRIGEECNASCLRLICGDANDTGAVTVTDAVFLLNVSMGQATCDLTVCDVNDDGAVDATDALVVLGVASGLDTPLSCPAF